MRYLNVDYEMLTRAENELRGTSGGLRASSTLKRKRNDDAPPVPSEEQLTHVDRSLPRVPSLYGASKPTSPLKRKRVSNGNDNDKDIAPSTVPAKKARFDPVPFPPIKAPKPQAKPIFRPLTAAQLRLPKNTPIEPAQTKAATLRSAPAHLSYYQTLRSADPVRRSAGKYVVPAPERASEAVGVREGVEVLGREMRGLRKRVRRAGMPLNVKILETELYVLLQRTKCVMSTLAQHATAQLSTFKAEIRRTREYKARQAADQEFNIAFGGALCVINEDGFWPHGGRVLKGTDSLPEFGGDKTTRRGCGLVDALTARMNAWDAGRYVSHEAAIEQVK